MPRKVKQTYETEKEIFPTNLRRLMNEKGVSQEKLGKAIGIKRQTVSLYTTGQSKPDTDKLAAIASYFNVSAGWLLGKESERTPDVNTKAACRLTGLNEKSIEILQAMSDYERSLVDMLILDSESYEHYMRDANFTPDEEQIATEIEEELDAEEKRCSEEERREKQERRDERRQIKHEKKMAVAKADFYDKSHSSFLTAFGALIHETHDITPMLVKSGDGAGLRKYYSELAEAARLFHVQQCLVKFKQNRKDKIAAETQAIIEKRRKKEAQETQET